jgi:K+-transporting ATPase c subunit
LVSPNLKNSHVISNNFNVSTYFHSREKKKIRRPYNLNAPHIKQVTITLITVGLNV